MSSKAHIDKKTLEHLAKLARLELKESEEVKLITDISKILGHFEELQELDTSEVAPLTGGTDLKNIFREDPVKSQSDNGVSESTNRGAGTDAFPEEENGFLKIPPVFE